MKRTAHRPGSTGPCRVLVLALLALLCGRPLQAQQNIKELPGHDRYERMRGEIPAAARAVASGALRATWAEDGRSFEYALEGRQYRYDVASRKVTDLGEASESGFRFRRGGPARGRQFAFAMSPDSTLRAFYRDRNLYVSAADGSDEVAVTTDGSVEDRIKYGTASWVYGEELGQVTAMWWSPDGKKLAYYRFDESDVPDYYLQLDQVDIQDSLDVEAYPKAGKPNPVVDLFVYDVATHRSTRVDVRDGKPFGDDVVGHYVYQVAWSPDGSEITFNRTNRRQNVLEFTACSADTGVCRVVVREEWPASWVENHPPMRYLADGKRFLWISERTGFANLYLYDLSGRLLATLTNHDFEVASVEHVDEKAGQVWYTARDGDNPMKLQLHRVGLNGKGDVRLTDPAFNHAVMVAPDGKHFVDVAQTHDTPPVTRLMDARGKEVAQLAAGDTTRFHELGLRRAELFTFKAADGVTDLYGLLYKPSNFDPARTYPLLVTVYAGPATNGARETFAAPNALTEYGFLVASLDSRSAAGRGKRFLDAIYQKLGTVEIDDQAAGVRALAARPYVDGARVGIYGTSYGGYASAMAILRHPDVFAAASAASPVTDWRNYDSIYTERYMWLPQENKAGYDAGSAMTYAKNLKGRLLLYYGTADNNVHPSNMMQLITALQEADKSFEVQVGPDRGHSAVNADRMMEFFIENLVQPLPAVGSDAR
jgi:dipeptidyl-peptidase-4